MKTISILIAIIFFNDISMSQNSITEKYCQTYRSYYTMAINNITYNDNSTQHDSLKIYLEDKLPPINWWRTSIENKDPNPNYNITKNIKYINQKLVRIVNTSHKNILIIKPDGLLVFVLQAKNEKNEWIGLESLITPYCVWSYKDRFNDTLKPNYEIQTFTELFPGDFKTRYRLMFVFYTDKSFKNPQYYYSNEIEGTITRCKLINW